MFAWTQLKQFFAKELILSIACKLRKYGILQQKRVLFSRSSAEWSCKETSYWSKEAHCTKKGKGERKNMLCMINWEIPLIGIHPRQGKCTNKKIPWWRRQNFDVAILNANIGETTLPWDTMNGIKRCVNHAKRKLKREITRHLMLLKCKQEELWLFLVQTLLVPSAVVLMEIVLFNGILLRCKPIFQQDMGCENDQWTLSCFSQFLLLYFCSSISFLLSCQPSLNICKSNYKFFHFHFSCAVNLCMLPISIFIYHQWLCHVCNSFSSVFLTILQ